MARPGDWSPLGLHRDPTPGDPDVLQGIHGQMEELGSLAREVTSGLNRVLNESTDSFIGKTAEAVRKKIDGHLKRFIDSVGDSFGVSAPATLDYLNAVRDAQAKADQALAAAQGLSKDDPQLETLKSQAHDAQEAYDNAASVYWNKLSDASHMIQQPISGWQLFLQALGILAIILAVLGAIFGGWVGLIALAVNVALLIKTAVEFAEGKASVLDLVLAVIGVLFPSTKGLNVGQLSKGLFNTLKNLPKMAVGGINDAARGLSHILTNPGSLGNIFRGVTALPGLVGRGLVAIGKITLNAGRLVISGLKSVGGVIRNDFSLATIGVKGTLGKIGVYAISFGSRFLVSATLPLDFFELGIGARAAIKMGLGTRLSTPWAHLAQPVVGGGAHVGALTAEHFSLHQAGGSSTGFGGIAALHGLNSMPNFGGLGGVGAVHLGGGITPASLGHAVGNLGSGASAVDHLTALDHATGFDRTASGLLEPTATHFGAMDMGATHLGSTHVGTASTGVATPHLGVSSLHTGRMDVAGSATGLHTAISDSMSGIRSAEGHVADFHALGLPELKSIVDGDVSIGRMTPDGVSLHVGAQAGMPTTLHMNYRTMSFTNDAGHQVVVAPEVHSAVESAQARAAVGEAAPTPPPAVALDHTATSATPPPAAATTSLTPPPAAATTSLTPPPAAAATTGTATPPATAVTTGNVTNTATGAATPAPVRPHALDESAGGGQLAESTGVHGVTVQGDHAAVSAGDQLDQAGTRAGTGDTAGAVKALREDPVAFAVAPGHVPLRPTPQPHPGAAGDVRPPRSRFEAVTGGVGGRIGAQRLSAWNKYEAATGEATRTEALLNDLGGGLDKPSENIEQAAARVDAQTAAIGVDAARQDLAALHMDVDAIRARLDRLAAPAPHVTGGEARSGALDKLSAQLPGQEARSAEWRTFRDERDSGLRTKLDTEARFEHLTGDLAAHTDEAAARFVREDLFGGHYLRDDRHGEGFAPPDKSPREHAEESYRQQLHDAYQALADHSPRGIVPSDQWAAVRGELRERAALHFHWISERERALDHVARDVESAVADFRERDLFGGRYLPADEDRAAHLPDGTGETDGKALAGEDADGIAASLHDIREGAGRAYADAVDTAFRTEMRHVVDSVVDRALGGGLRAVHPAEAAGGGAATAARRAVDDLRAGLGHRIEQLSDRERWVRHADAALERELAKADDDVSGSFSDRFLSEEAEDWARTSLHNDIRAAHAKAHDTPAGAEGAGRLAGQNWESHVRAATGEKALAARLDYAEFRSVRMAEGRRAFDEALAGFDKSHVLTDLSGHQRERLLKEWDEAVEKAAEGHWFGHLGREDFRVAGGDAAAGAGLSSRSWSESFGDLRATLPARFEHEAALEEVLTNSARDFHGIVGHTDSVESFRNAVRPETLDTFGKDFRTQTVERYDKLWSAVEHDIKAWLRHESRHGDVFQETLTARDAVPLPRPARAADAPAPAPAAPAPERAAHGTHGTTAETPAPAAGPRRAGEAGTAGRPPEPGHVEGHAPEPASAEAPQVHLQDQVQLPERARPARPAPQPAPTVAEHSAAQAPHAGHVGEDGVHGGPQDAAQEQLRRERAERIGARLVEALRKYSVDKPPFQAGPAFDARRVAYEDGWETTELRVRIAFTGDTAAGDAEQVMTQAQEGVARWSGGQGPASYGGRVHIALQQVAPGQNPHLTVDLAGRDTAAGTHTWWKDAGADHYARRIGLHVGLFRGPDLEGKSVAAVPETDTGTGVADTGATVDVVTAFDRQLVPVGRHAFDTSAVAPVTDRPFQVVRTTGPDGAALTQVHVAVELPDLRYQPKSVQQQVRTHVGDTVSTAFGDLVARLAGDAHATVAVRFTAPGRDAAIRVLPDATGALRLEPPTQGTLTGLALALNDPAPIPHALDALDTVRALTGTDGALSVAGTSGALSVAGLDDDVTVAGTDDDLTVADPADDVTLVDGADDITLVDGAVDTVDTLVKPGKLAAPGKTGSATDAIHAWLSGLPRAGTADTDKAGLLDPERLFPTELQVFPVVAEQDRRPADIVAEAARAVRADLRTDLRDRLGQDPFGDRRLPETPVFLRPSGRPYDFGALRSTQRAAFFRRLDLRRTDVPTAAAMDPRNLPVEPRTVTAGAYSSRSSGPGLKKQKIPHQVHSIWFGGPLHDDGVTGSRTDFRANITAGAQANPDFDFVLWTDVSRADIQDARAAAGQSGLTEHQQQILSMLEWADAHPNIRIVNIDEVFSRDTPMLMGSEVLGERARGGKSFAVASDIARVEILARFGGIYTDGDNRIHRLTDLVRTVAARDDGFALLRADLPRPQEDLPQGLRGLLGRPPVRDSRRMNNAAIVSVAGNRAVTGLREILRENVALPLAPLLRRVMLGLRTVDDDTIGADATRWEQFNEPAIEIVHRTGPNARTFDTLAERLGHTARPANGGPPVADRFLLGAVPPEAITVESRGSWNVAFTPSDLPQDRLAATLRRTVVNLHAELRNRPGILALKTIAKAAEDLPSAYREPFWRQALELFHASLGENTGQVRLIARQRVTNLPVSAHGTAVRLFPDAAFNGTVPVSTAQVQAPAAQSFTAPPGAVEGTSAAEGISATLTRMHTAYGTYLSDGAAGLQAGRQGGQTFTGPDGTNQELAEFGLGGVKDAGRGIRRFFTDKSGLRLGGARNQGTLGVPGDPNAPGTVKVDRIGGREIARLNAHRVGDGAGSAVLSLHDDADWAQRQGNWRALFAGTAGSTGTAGSYASREPGALMSVRKDAPWAGRPVYYLTSHGQSDKAKIFLDSQEKKIVDAQGMAAILRADPVFTALRAQHQDLELVLVVCRSGQTDESMGQELADRLGITVHAPNGTVALNHSNVHGSTLLTVFAEETDPGVYRTFTSRTAASAPTVAVHAPHEETVPVVSVTGPDTDTASLVTASPVTAHPVSAPPHLADIPEETEAVAAAGTVPAPTGLAGTASAEEPFGDEDLVFAASLLDEKGEPRADLLGQDAAPAALATAPGTPPAPEVTVTAPRVKRRPAPLTLGTGTTTAAAVAAPPVAAAPVAVAPVAVAAQDSSIVRKYVVEVRKGQVEQATAAGIFRRATPMLLSDDPKVAQAAGVPVSGADELVTLVQRVVHDTDPQLRVSADGTLALSGAGEVQEAFATAEAVAKAAEALRAAGSGVTLVLDTAVRVRFTHGGRERVLHPVRPEFAESVTDICRDIARDLIGGMPDHLVFRGPDGTTDLGPMRATDGLKVSELHRLADAVTQVADGKRLSAYVPDVSWAVTKIAKRASGPVPVTPMPGVTYGQYVGNAPQFAPQRQVLHSTAGNVGINEHAWANVGEAYLTQSIGTLDAEGRFTLANHADAFHPVENPYGYHYATVVLQSEDGTSQVTLENYSRQGVTGRMLKEAVRQNLERFGDRLPDLLTRCQADAAAKSAAADTAKAAALAATGNEVATANAAAAAATTAAATANAAVAATQALIDLRAARGAVTTLETAAQATTGTGGAAGTVSVAGTEAGTAALDAAALDAAKKAAANAETLAERRLRDLSARQGLITPTKLWHMRFVGKGGHRTFHDLLAGLREQDAPGIVVNPLTAVVVGGHENVAVPSRWVSFEPGAKESLAVDERRKIDYLAQRVARVGLWSHRNGLPLPSVRISAGANGSRYKNPLREQQARQQAEVRLNTVMEIFRSELEESLELLQKTVTGPRLDADRFVVAGHNRGRAFPEEGARPTADYPADALRRRVQFDVEMHPPVDRPAPSLARTQQYLAAGSPLLAQTPGLGLPEVHSPVTPRSRPGSALYSRPSSAVFSPVRPSPNSLQVPPTPLTGRGRPASWDASLLSPPPARVTFAEPPLREDGPSTTLGGSGSSIVGTRDISALRNEVNIQLGKLGRSLTVDDATVAVHYLALGPHVNGRDDRAVGYEIAGRIANKDRPLRMEGMAPTAVPAAQELSTPGASTSTAPGAGSSQVTVTPLTGRSQSLLRSLSDTAAAGSRERTWDGQEAFAQIHGPNVLGTWSLPPTPGFLTRALEPGRIPAAALGAFLRRIDLTARDLPTASDVDPARLLVDDTRTGRATGSATATSISTGTGLATGEQPAQVPHVAHQIWFGRPLTAEGATRTAFLDIVAANRRTNSAFTSVLWTDIPRADFQRVHQARDAGTAPSGRLAEVGRLLDWAVANDIVLLDFDEVFSDRLVAALPPHAVTLAHFVRAERARGTGFALASASDAARLLLLHVLGGFYFDVDDVVHRGLVPVAQQVAEHRDGLAMIWTGEGVDISTMGAVAGGRGTTAYLALMAGHVTMPLHGLHREQFGKNIDLDAYPVGPREETLLRTGTAHKKLGTDLGYTDRETDDEKITPLMQLLLVDPEFVSHGESQSWAAAPVVRPDQEAVVVEATTAAVVHLLREPRNREGVVNLPALHVLLEGIADPAARLAAWQAAVAFVAGLPGEGERIRAYSLVEPKGTVTDVPAEMVQVFAERFPHAEERVALDGLDGLDDFSSDEDFDFAPVGGAGDLDDFGSDDGLDFAPVGGAGDLDGLGSDDGLDFAPHAGAGGSADRTAAPPARDMGSLRNEVNLRLRDLNWPGTVDQATVDGHYRAMPAHLTRRDERTVANEIAGLVANEGNRLGADGGAPFTGLRNLFSSTPAQPQASAGAAAAPPVLAVGGISFTNLSQRDAGLVEKGLRLLTLLAGHPGIAAYLNGRPARIVLEQRTVDSPAEIRAHPAGPQISLAAYYFESYSLGHVAGMLAHEFGVHPLPASDPKVVAEGRLLEGASLSVPGVPSRTMTTSEAMQHDHVLAAIINGPYHPVYERTVIQMASLLKDDAEVHGDDGNVTDVLDCYLMDVASIAVTNDKRLRGLPGAPGSAPVRADIAASYNHYRDRLHDQLPARLRPHLPAPKTAAAVAHDYVLLMRRSLAGIFGAPSIDRSSAATGHVAAPARQISVDGTSFPVESGNGFQWFKSPDGGTVFIADALVAGGAVRADIAAQITRGLNGGLAVHRVLLPGDIGRPEDLLTAAEDGVHESVLSPTRVEFLASPLPDRTGTGTGTGPLALRRPAEQPRETTLIARGVEFLPRADPARTTFIPFATTPEDAVRLAVAMNGPHRDLSAAHEAVAVVGTEHDIAFLGDGMLQIRGPVEVGLTPIALPATVRTHEGPTRMTNERGFHHFRTSEGGTVHLSNTLIEEGVLDEGAADLVLRFTSGGIAVHRPYTVDDAVTPPERVTLRPLGGARQPNAFDTDGTEFLFFATTPERARSLPGAGPAGARTRLASAFVGPDRDIVILNATTVQVRGETGMDLQPEPRAAAPSFADVTGRYPLPLADTPRWTMWGHNGDTPQASSYAVEFPSLDLRGVYHPPAADRGMGTWQWYVGEITAQSVPVAATPLTLRSPNSLGPAVSAEAQPRPPAMAEAAGAAVDAALDAVTWSQGLRWRTGDEDLYVFGAARPDGPGGVFAEGLRPAGGRLVHPAVHVRDGGEQDSMWVTASRLITWLRDQVPAEAATTVAVPGMAAGYGWRYDVAAPGGVDVNETLDLAAPHPERREVLLPGGVDGRHIRGAQRLERGRSVGPYLTNAGFVSVRGALAATKGTAG